MRSTKPVEKDVQDILMKTRKCRRPMGAVTYPADYSRGMKDYDHWNHMLVANCCGNLTMHQFDEPPVMVLDLGCGSGFWALEAAKRWPNSIIIGYDILAIQPDLLRFPDFCAFAPRITWVQGNLLDGLPYSPNTFDFVRIAGMGLGIPEDEWQLVLEDVERVLKIGGVIEVIEEDLIFPCGVPPKQREKPASVPINVEVAAASSVTSMSNKSSDALSQPWSPSFDDTLLMSPSFNVSSSTVSGSPKSRFSSYSTHPCPPVESRPSTPDPIIASQDHTKLQTAWEAMLAHNFLATNLLSVLPFYLSATFINVKTHPAIKVPLPPNSPSAKKKLESPQVFEPSPANGRFRGSMSPFALRPAAECWSAAPFDSAQQTIPSWSSMHLGKAMETVKACKESLWLEYERLGLGEDLPPVTCTTRAEDVFALSSPSSMRESFESDWTNWERDMTDRVGMRNALKGMYGWIEPPGEKPDWRIWRKAIDATASSTSLESYAASASSDDETEICRAIKGFVCWKGPPVESE